MATDTEREGIRFDFLLFFFFSPSWSSSLSGVSSLLVELTLYWLSTSLGSPPPHHLRTNITSILTSGATKTASSLQSQRASGIHGKVLDSKLQLLEKYCNMISRHSKLTRLTLIMKHSKWKNQTKTLMKGCKIKVAFVTLLWKERTASLTASG